MEGLLTLFVGMTAVAIVIQAGVLIGIYFVSKRVCDQVEGFIREARPLLAPMKSITENLRTASAELAEIGASAKVQFGRVDEMLTDTKEALQAQLERFERASETIIERVTESVGLVQDSVLRPVLQFSNFARGLSRGFDFLFSRRPRPATSPRPRDEEDEDMFI